MSDCHFGSPPIYYLVLYDNIVFGFLANKYSLSLYDIDDCFEENREDY